MMFTRKFDKRMEDVKREMEDKLPIRIVDVRFEDEYIEGHLPNALLIPLPELEIKAPKVLNKDDILYVYCRSGQRSQKAVSKLQQLGYTNVFNIGGIIHWPYDVEKGN